MNTHTHTIFSLLSNASFCTQVGISEDCRLYVAGGVSRATENTCIVMYTKEKLQELKVKLFLLIFLVVIKCLTQHQKFVFVISIVAKLLLAQTA